MLLVILKAKKFFERFRKTNDKKISQEEFRFEKGIKRKGNTFMLNGKTKIFFNSWIDKKDIV